LSSGPIYQYLFDGGTGTPLTSGGAGGGVLTTSGPNAKFTGTGVTAASGDNAYTSVGGAFSGTDVAVSNALTNVPSFGDQITVTAWIKETNGIGTTTGGNGQFGKIFFINSAGVTAGNPVYFALSTSGALQAEISGSNPNSVTSGTYGYISSGTIASVGDTAYHFVAFTFDGTNAGASNLSYYTANVGGTVTNIGTGDLPTTAAIVPSFTGDTIDIGNVPTTGLRELVGNIDDVRVYPGVASLSDLQTIANNVDVSAVPEPVSLGLLSVSGLALARRRKTTPSGR